MAPTVLPNLVEKMQGKKKAKADRPSASSGQDPMLGTDNIDGQVDSTANGTENSGESPYLKELNKNIRNIVKKLAACNKTETVIAEAPGLSLDDLIAKKRINADQKAQILKKPALQAELARLEDQVVHYRKFGKDYEDRYNKEKLVLQASQNEAVAKARQESADETTLAIQKKADEDLLVLSQFLHAAAAKRDHDEIDPVEKAAFEGVLLLVYQGNGASLAAFKDIAAGSVNKVSNTLGEELDFTYEQIKKISLANAATANTEDADNATSENVSAAETDPTIAHAGLTELEDTVPLRVVAADRDETLATPVQSSIAPEAANAIAERKWDPQSSIVSETPSGEGWVEVPRDPAETDTGVTATPAAIHNSVSWAEEVNADAVAAEKPAENDGFEQVVHRGGRGRASRGEYRGRGRGGEYRGRGRGDGDRRGGGRGRGRGGDGSRRGDGESHSGRQSRGSSGW